MFQAKSKSYAAVSAVVIRADGTRENLGVIARTNLKKSNSIFKLLKGLVKKNG